MKQILYIFTMIAITSSLAFKSLTYEPTPCRAELPTGWYYMHDMDTNCIISMERSNQYTNIDSTPVIAVKHIKKVTAYNDFNEKVAMDITFDKEGTEIWNKAIRTDGYVYYCFVINNKLIYFDVFATQSADIATVRRDNSEYTLREFQTFAKQIERESKQARK